MVQAAAISTLLAVLAVSFEGVQAARPVWYQCGGLTWRRWGHMRGDDSVDLPMHSRFQHYHLVYHINYGYYHYDEADDDHYQDDHYEVVYHEDHEVVYHEDHEDHDYKDSQNHHYQVFYD
ncbi:hypothetical protein FRC01_007827 [Tulasnella sp. 417]|nr:hypothetical protein FRC01_007827 [Tulasnella sp. 417]